MERQTVMPQAAASSDSAVAAADYGIWSLDAAAAGLTQMRGLLVDGALRSAFDAAAALLLGLQGRLIVTGVGKSGHVGAKLAATFASTGTPAQFVHAAEASHGDLGMIRADDAVMALSWSGETQELGDILAYCTRFRTPLIAVTGAADGTLARAADIALALPRAPEACPHNLAPTTSTTMQMAIGDALAVAVLRQRGFTASDFRAFHPGGRLGARLKPVSALMIGPPHMPTVAPEASVREAVAAISSKGFGVVGVVDGAGCLAGVITDGDIRRFVDARADTPMRVAFGAPAASIMNRAPVVAPPGMLATEAVAVMENRKISSMFVVEDARPMGVVTLLQFLRSGII
jgi:arabinose-5-phosphate isomerase